MIAKANEIAHRTKCANLQCAAFDAATVLLAKPKSKLHLPFPSTKYTLFIGKSFFEDLVEELELRQENGSRENDCLRLGCIYFSGGNRKFRKYSYNCNCGLIWFVPFQMD